MSLKDDISLEGALLAVGETRRIVCPSCHGGASQERSMNIQRTSEGVLYKCHRATCDARGFTGSSAASLPYKTPDRTPEQYEDELLPLDKVDKEFFSDRFELERPEDNIMRNQHGEYVLPIYGPDQYIRGYNVRQPWEGAPRNGRTQRPKARVYMHSLQPVQSTYVGSRDYRIVVLVEDQVSAIKAAQYASVEHAVALIGCHLDIPRVREIAMLRPSQVLLALDSDATDKAFKLAREFGLAFPKMRVVILDRDIKDTPKNEIDTVLGLV